MPGFIDAHVHVWPQTASSKPARYTPADHLAIAKPAGVGRTVLIQPGMYRFDNSYMMEAVASHPGVFSAVAVANADSPSVEQEMTRLKRLGTRGFRITAGSALPWTESDGMHTMWRVAAREHLAMCPLINPDYLSTVAAMCEQHPQTTVVIDHLARIGATGRIDDADVRLLCSMAKYPRVHVKVSAFYALGAKAPPYLDLAPLIRRVFESFGPKRLMWASDAPYQADPPENYRASVELVRAQLDFLKDEDRHGLLESTAAAVFF